MRSARNVVPTKRDHMTLTIEAEATTEGVTTEETSAAEKETIAIAEEVVSTIAGVEETGKTAEVVTIKTESREPRILTNM